MGHICGESRGQGALFPLSLDELIPAEHLCRVIDGFVGRLDLSALGFAKAVAGTTGRPPYDPADLLKLYIYGYLQQVRSSRRLEAECRRNVEVMWVLGRLVPDHKTIAEFRRTQGAPPRATCAAFAGFLRDAGVVGGDRRVEVPASGEPQRGPVRALTEQGARARRSTSPHTARG